MHQHYDAAYRFQMRGDFRQADTEHTLFLVTALDHTANFHANIGDYMHAVPAYDEALALAPTDFSLLMDYAGAALDAHDARKAKVLLQTTIGLDFEGTTEQQKADVHRLFGGTLRALNDPKGAAAQFQEAAALNPDIENLCALGDFLLTTDSAKAAAVFAKVIARYGDTASVHMRIGRIYALAGNPDIALEQFKKAIAEDPVMPGAHYSLGAAYMTSSKRDYRSAESEFRRELALHPNDIFSYPQLGHIALMNHNYRAAESDFKRAIAVNPLVADNFTQLGKLYTEINRPGEAEAAFRKAIELTVDPAHNFYEIERAHYRLGRLLIAKGNKVEGERELKISQELLVQRDRESTSPLSGKEVEHNPLERTKVATPRQMEELNTFVRQVGPLIAGSYNNLGVHAALRNDFPKAAGYFQLATKWDPDLPGVDANWGRAAFAAHDCAQAVVPLRKSLKISTSDPEIRSMLEQCQANASITPVQ